MQLLLIATGFEPVGLLSHGFTIASTEVFLFYDTFQ